MNGTQWLEDKEKDGERFTNSYCFTYCLKCFLAEHRVEVWAKGQGYQKTYVTLAGALFDYTYIKSLALSDVWDYVAAHYETIHEQTNG